MNLKFLFFSVAVLVYPCLVGMAEPTALPVAAKFAMGQRQFQERIAEIKSSAISDMASASSEYLGALRVLKNDLSFDAESAEAVDQEIARFMAERDVSELNLSSRSDKLSIAQVGYIEKMKVLRVGQNAALAGAFRQYVSFLGELETSADDSVPATVVDEIKKELQRVQSQISPDSPSDTGFTAGSPVAGVVSSRPVSGGGAVADDAGIIGQIFHGQVLKFNPATCEISLIYDFSDSAQKGDWEPAGWINDSGGEWDVANGAVQLNRLPGPLLHKAVFRDVSIVSDFHVAGSDGSAGVVIGATRNGDFYCMMGLERGKHSILRKYEKGSRAGALSKAHDSPFRVYGKGKVGLAISGKSVHGEVGLGRFRSDDETRRRGQVGVFAPGSNVRFESVRISGVLDERWYKTEKRRAENAAKQ